MPPIVTTRIARISRIQGFRYFVVAGTTALFYLGVVAIGIWLGWYYIHAILAAHAILIISAFPVYRSVVFESQGRLLPEFIRFLSVWLSGLVAGLVITPLLVEILGWQPFIAQVIAVAAVGIGSFAGHRWFSFRTRRTTQFEEHQPSVESDPL
ncbi:MAG: GtrA family protein [Demequinaceae bacterium]|nr:GtrA family protein [Demequinaceae bacterium]